MSRRNHSAHGNRDQPDPQEWSRLAKGLSGGARIEAKEPDRQTAEIHIRIAMMNRSNTLRTAEVIRGP